LLKKGKDGLYKISLYNCLKCGGTIEKMQNPTEDANFQCLGCGRKFKIDEKTLDKKMARNKNSRYIV
jgi:DNA-directed RNA polymerase subunit RPC12/RpoP